MNTHQQELDECKGGPISWAYCDRITRQTTKYITESSAGRCPTCGNKPHAGEGTYA